MKALIWAKNKDWVPPWPDGDRKRSCPGVKMLMLIMRWIGSSGAVSNTCN